MGRKLQTRQLEQGEREAFIELIDEYFESINRLDKPNQNPSRFEDLATKINSFYYNGEDVIKSKYLAEIYNATDKAGKKSDEKLRRIREFLTEKYYLQMKGFDRAFDVLVNQTVHELKTLSKENQWAEAEALYKKILLQAKTKDDLYAKHFLMREFARCTIQSTLDLEDLLSIAKESLVYFNKHKYECDCEESKFVIGSIQIVRGDLYAAEAHFESYLKYAESKRDIFMVASANGNLGMVNVRKGNVDLADKFFVRCLELGNIVLQSPDPKFSHIGGRMLATTEFNRADIYERKGDLTIARECYVRAAYFFRNLDAEVDLGKTLLGLVKTDLRTGRFDVIEMNEKLDEAEKIFRKYAIADRIFTCVKYRSRGAQKTGENLKALKLLLDFYHELDGSESDELIVSVLKEINGHAIENNVTIDEQWIKRLAKLSNVKQKSVDITHHFLLGKLYAHRGEFEKRDAILQPFIKDIDNNLPFNQNPHSKMFLLKLKGEALLLMEKFEDSIECLTKTIDHYSTTKDNKNLCSVFVNIGDAYYLQNKFDLSFYSFSMAETLMSDLEFCDFSVIIHMRLGEILFHSNQEAGLKYLNRALEINDKYKQPFKARITAIMNKLH